MLSTLVKNYPDQTLKVRPNGPKEITYLLYKDDGVSYDYENEEYFLDSKSTKDKEGLLKGSFKALKSNKDSYGTIVWRWMTVKH